MGTDPPGFKGASENIFSPCRPEATPGRSRCRRRSPSDLRPRGRSKGSSAAGRRSPAIRRYPFFNSFNQIEANRGEPAAFRSADQTSGPGSGRFLVLQKNCLSEDFALFRQVFGISLVFGVREAPLWQRKSPRSPRTAILQP